MIRFSWLQFRLQAAVAAGVLAIIALALALTGPHLAHLYATTVANCSARGDCSTATVSFLSHYRLSAGSRQPHHRRARPRRHVLGRTPCGPRTGDRAPTAWYGHKASPVRRWLAVKLGLIGLVSVAAAGLLSLIVTWWSRPIDQLNMNQFTSVFDQRGVVPIGYAAFAFVLGVAAGLLARRTLPAMAATLVAFVSVRVLVTFWVRPHLMAPVRTTSRLRHDHWHVIQPDRQWAAERDGRQTRGVGLFGPHRKSVGRFGQRGLSQPRRLPPKPGVGGMYRQAPRSAGVPASQSLLGFPVVRDGHLHRSRRGLERPLLLVRPAAAFLTTRRDYAGRVLGTGYEIGELEVPEISGERRQT